LCVVLAGPNPNADIILWVVLGRNLDMEALVGICPVLDLVPPYASLRKSWERKDIIMVNDDYLMSGKSNVINIQS